MGTEARSRPGFVLPIAGAALVGMAAARLVGGPGAGPAGPWFAVAIGLVGAGLVGRGLAQLRRARAAFPGLSWWGLLRGELATLGVVAVLLSAWAALPPGLRDHLARSVREVFELIHIARGRH